MKPTPKTQTQQHGANLERKAWMAKLRRELKGSLPTRVLFGDVPNPVNNALQNLKAWGKARTTRFNKKPGGLGRK